MTRVWAIALIVGGAVITYCTTVIFYGPGRLRALGLTFVTLGVWGLIERRSPRLTGDQRGVRLKSALLIFGAILCLATAFLLVATYVTMWDPVPPARP